MKGFLLLTVLLSSMAQATYAQPKNLPTDRLIMKCEPQDTRFQYYLMDDGVVYDKEPSPDIILISIWFAYPAMNDCPLLPRVIEIDSDDATLKQHHFKAVGRKMKLVGVILCSPAFT